MQGEACGVMTYIVKIWYGDLKCFHMVNTDSSTLVHLLDMMEEGNVITIELELPSDSEKPFDAAEKPKELFNVLRKM